VAYVVISLDQSGFHRSLCLLNFLNCRLFRIEVGVLYEGGKGGFDFEAEEVWDFVLVSEVEHADGPIYLTVELGDYVPLDLFHRLRVAEVVPSTLDASLQVEFIDDLHLLKAPHCGLITQLNILLELLLYISS